MPPGLVPAAKSKLVAKCFWLLVRTPTRAKNRQQGRKLQIPPVDNHRNRLERAPCGFLAYPALMIKIYK
jgi:hypothetical protein